MEAKARGATVIHVDPRFSRTSALADLYVPIRAGTDIAFLGGVINHVLHDGVGLPRVRPRLHQRADDRQRGLPGHRGRSTGCSPASTRSSGSYDPASWQYEGAFVGARRRASATRRAHARAEARRQGGGEAAAGAADARPDACSTRAASCRSSSATTPATRRRWSSGSAASRRTLFARGLRAVRRRTPAASARPRSSTASAGRSTPSARSTSAPRRSCSCCSATSAGPAAASWRCAGTPRIQGSSDIPTLYDLLPGYIPMPHAHAHEDLDAVRRGRRRRDEGLLGQHARLHRQPAQGVLGRRGHGRQRLLLRLPAAADRQPLHLRHGDGAARRAPCKGYFLFGENPAVGSANARMQRLGMAKLDWLVVRDFSLIESATWWKDGPEIETGEMRTEDIAHRGVLLPGRRAHREGRHASPTPSGCCSGTTRRVEPQGDAAQRPVVHLPPRPAHPRAAGGLDGRARPPGARPDLGLPDRRAARRAERRGGAAPRSTAADADGKPLSAYTELKDDGSTRCGCWIYCGVYADGVNQAARRKPGDASRTGSAPSGRWAWPANRRILYNRASADPDGKPWSERKALVWWDAEQGKWTGHDVPDFEADEAAGLPARRRTRAGPDAIARRRPVHHAGRRPRLAVRAGRRSPTARCRRTTSRRTRPFANPLYRAAAQPRSAGCIEHAGQPLPPRSGDEPGADVFPFVVTTYRLTEHFTAGGMSRWTPYLAELQPEFFCEVSPELAARARAWSTAAGRRIVTARGGDRGAGAGHRPDGAADGRRAHGAPDRPAVPLGPERLRHAATRRTSCRSIVARPERRTSRRSRR